MTRSSAWAVSSVTGTLDVSGVETLALTGAGKTPVGSYVLDVLPAGLVIRIQ